MLGYGWLNRQMLLVWPGYCVLSRLTHTTNGSMVHA